MTVQAQNLWRKKKHKIIVKNLVESQSWDLKKKKKNETTLYEKKKSWKTNFRPF